MTQLTKLRDLMLPGGWFTLDELSLATGYSQPSISTRLRDFRKPEGGRYLVEKRLREGAARIWEYRLQPRPKVPGLFDEIEEEQNNEELPLRSMRQEDGLGRGAQPPRIT